MVFDLDLMHVFHIFILFMSWEWEPSRNVSKKKKNVSYPKYIKRRKHQWGFRKIVLNAVLE